MKQERGFTIFELVIVLIMVGLLTAALVPLIAAQHGRDMDQGEREALHKARDALIAYGIHRGGLPVPLNSAAAGFEASYRPNFPADWDLTGPDFNESYLPWSNANLGVNAFGSYRKYFWYDVRRELRRDFGSAANPLPSPNPTGLRDLNATPTGANFCANVRLALAAAAADPRTCRLPAVGEEAVACPGGAAQASTAAFTLVSFGSDFVPNMAHASLNVVPPAIVRNYENPQRGINRTRDGGVFYDDMVAGITLAELARACDRAGIVDPAAPVGVCPTGQKALLVINTSGGADGIRISGPPGQCISVANNTSLNLGCFLDTQVVTIHTTVATCGTNTANKGNSASATLSALDTNNDGTVRFSCPTNDATTCTIN